MGRPLGSQNKDKRFKAALVRYVDADPKRLDEMAEKLWLKAMGGDVVAMKEVADRLDGKVAQPVGGSDDLPPVQIEEVIRTIVDPRDKDSEGVQAPPEPSQV
jgi:hypothetical protein